MKKTLYEVLGVDAKATTEEIAARYRALCAELAAKTSTDVDNEQKFLKSAAETLTLPEHRARYDRSLHAVVAEVSSDIAEEEASSLATWGIVGAVVLAAIAGIYFLSHRGPPPPAQPAVVVQVARPAPVAAAVEAKAEVSAAAPREPGVLSAAEVFNRNAGSVVTIAGVKRDGRPFLGSGVVIASESVISDCHVALNTNEIRVKSRDRWFDVAIRYVDQGHDLCQLSVSGLESPAAQMRTDADLNVGDKVYALGTPQGLELSLSEGLISSLRDFDGARIIQTTAAISPGSSGGGLFDQNGRLVGITTFQSATGQNLNFAVPVSWIAALPERNGNTEAMFSARTAAARVTTAEVAALSTKLAGHWSCVGQATLNR